MCPKERRGNLYTVGTALSVAVQRFNKGSTALLDMKLEGTAMLDMKLELRRVAGLSLGQYIEKENSSRVVTAN